MAMSPRMFPMSDGLYSALGEAAQKRGVSMAQLLRESVAKTISYDLKAEPAPTRAKKYASAEERIAAQKERNKAKKNREKAVLARLQAMADKGELDPETLAMLRKAS